MSPTPRGMPAMFTCPSCLERHADAVELTGRKRSLAYRHDAGGLRALYAREYRCACGKVGWSRHIDLERKQDAETHAAIWREARS